MSITAEDLVRAAKAEIREINVVEAQSQLDDKVVFIDVREPPEWQDGTVPGALCIPRGVLEWRVASEDALKDKTAPLVVYFKSGGRSALAAQTLQQLGFSNVRSLAGSFEAWADNGQNLP
jgi:rhodanese-related sulfurtransferase